MDFNDPNKVIRILPIDPKENKIINYFKNGDIPEDVVSKYIRNYNKLFKRAETIHKILNNERTKP